MDYADPDGAPAVCHNTERAYAEITLSERRGGRWRTAGHWRLDGTAHAKVGTRPERGPVPGVQGWMLSRWHTPLRELQSFGTRLSPVL